MLSSEQPFRLGRPTHGRPDWRNPRSHHWSHWQRGTLAQEGGVVALGEDRAGGGGSLDSIGRTILQAADYGWIAIAILISVGAFMTYRWVRYRSLPTTGDCRPKDGPE